MGMFSICFFICFTHLMRHSMSNPVGLLEIYQQCSGDHYYYNIDGTTSSWNVLSSANSRWHHPNVKQQAVDDIDDYFRSYIKDQSKPEPEIRLSDISFPWRSPDINKSNRDDANKDSRNGHEREVRRSQAENIRRMNCIRIFQNSIRLLANCLQDG